ncbi:MAG: nitroreductase family protein [Elusimicrobiaceae bacterium]|nr:nitroreductase family protein [Elusimicrobiaceae bacterium]
MSFIDLIKKRRSRYLLNSKIPISEQELEKLIQSCIKYTPSAFNSQSARVVLLLKTAHKLLWDLTLEKLRSLVAADHFEPTREKINSFSKSYATLLFYEDQSVIERLKSQFPAYKDSFDEWSVEGNAMLQFSIWTALAEAKIGASLQHYNPIIDAEVAAAFHIPNNWKMVAQMPLGGCMGEESEKTFFPISQRFRIEK